MSPPGTLETHTNNSYSKLSDKNRGSAVSRAQALSLLSTTMPQQSNTDQVFVPSSLYFGR
jgi:hypothetical protein